MIHIIRTHCTRKENTMNNEIVYVAELDQDVDDIIAVRYLHMQHALKCVV